MFQREFELFQHCCTRVLESDNVLGERVNIVNADAWRDGRDRIVVCALKRRLQAECVGDERSRNSSSDGFDFFRQCFGFPRKLEKPLFLEVIGKIGFDVRELTFAAAEEGKKFSLLAIERYKGGCHSGFDALGAFEMTFCDLRRVRVRRAFFPMLF